MITIRKLQTLSPSARRRKIVRLLEAYEEARLDDGTYLRELVRLIRDDAELPDDVRSANVGLDGEHAVIDLRAVNALRHRLAAALGVAPGDWDLREPAGYGTRAVGARGLAGGALVRVTLYLEAIRSPFNLGSIVRTAAAFGVRRVIADGCPDARHPRFLRSAMGAADMVDLEPGTAAGLPQRIPLVALELGGTPVSEFDFPTEGVLLVGSEELGLSPDLLRRASHRVSIPMPGPKASLNVGVAAGVVLAFWSAAVAGATR